MNNKDSKENIISIVVKGLPKLLRYTIDSSTLVENIRVRVSNDHPCQLDFLSLQFNNNVLDNNLTLNDCGVINGSVLYANSNFKSGLP